MDERIEMSADNTDESGRFIGFLIAFILLVFILFSEKMAHMRMDEIQEQIDLHHPESVNQ